MKVNHFHKIEVDHFYNAREEAEEICDLATFNSEAGRDAVLRAIIAVLENDRRIFRKIMDMEPDEDIVSNIEIPLGSSSKIVLLVPPAYNMVYITMPDGSQSSYLDMLMKSVNLFMSIKGKALILPQIKSAGEIKVVEVKEDLLSDV